MCLPQNISSLVLYFNKDLFKRFEIPPPRDGMLWNELVVKAQQLTRDKNGQQVRGADPDMPQAGTAQPAIYGLGVEPVIIRLAPFIWSNGGEVVDDDQSPTRFTLNTPQAEEAIAQLFYLRTQFGAVPNDEEVEAEDFESRFANGRLAMFLDSRRAVPMFREAAKFDWDVASLPYYDKPASILHSDAYCMTKAAKVEGRGLAIRRVRGRARGRAGDRQDGPDGALPEEGRAVGRLPRSRPEAGELAGVPGRDRHHPARADDLHVARDRGRHGRSAGERDVSRPAAADW